MNEVISVQTCSNALYEVRFLKAIPVARHVSGKKNGILTVNLLPKMFSDYNCGPIVDFEMLNRELWYLKVRKKYALGHYYQ